MTLRGQARVWRSERGYAMAAMLVSIAIMSLMLSAAMPVWQQQVTREKEAELIFRGEQYARAVGLFQRKFAGAFPPDIDLLVEQKFLRRKYRDPMSEDGEFEILYQSTGAGPAPGQTTTQFGGTVQQPDPAALAEAPGGRPSAAAGSGRPTGVRVGVLGVVSKSKEPSIRLYMGRSRYDQWQFVYTAQALQPGGIGAGQSGPRVGPAPGIPAGQGQGRGAGQQPGPGQFGRPPGSGGTGGRPGSVQVPPGGSQPRTRPGGPPRNQ